MTLLVSIYFHDSDLREPSSFPSMMKPYGKSGGTCLRNSDGTFWNTFTVGISDTRHFRYCGWYNQPPVIGAGPSVQRSPRLLETVSRSVSSSCRLLHVGPISRCLRKRRLPMPSTIARQNQTQHGFTVRFIRVKIVLSHSFLL